MMHQITRRQFLQGSAAAAGASALGLLPNERLRAEESPASPVSIACCKAYEPDALLEQLGKMLDRIGGLGKAIAGKTVAVKVNLTGSPKQQALGKSAGRTYQVHPHVVLAVATLLDRAGAKRIRFLEGTYQRGPMPDYLAGAGWDLKALA